MRNTSEIAKQVRNDIKAAHKAGKLPKGLKVSVTTDYFSGGSAIRVSIKAVPEGFVILNPEHVQAYLDAPHEQHGWRIPRYTPEAASALEIVRACVLAYHVDNSTDDGGDKCWNVNFYESTGWDWQLEDADRKAQETKIKADRVAAELAAQQPAPAAETPAKPRVVVHLVEWTPAPHLRLVK